MEHDVNKKRKVNSKKGLNGKRVVCFDSEELEFIYYFLFTNHFTFK
jgi:hypothetical protein